MAPVPRMVSHYKSAYFPHFFARQPLLSKDLFSSDLDRLELSRTISPDDVSTLFDRTPRGVFLSWFFTIPVKSCLSPPFCPLGVALGMVAPPDGPPLCLCSYLYHPTMVALFHLLSRTRLRLAQGKNR